MLYLLLSILTTASLFIIFKYFEKYDVNIFQAVVFNYLTASLLGVLLNLDTVEKTFSTCQAWFELAAVLGLLFISVFYLLGYTAQKLGVSVSSVANKMSMIIPVIVAVYMYGDKMQGLKVLGIVIALLAVFFTSLRGKPSEADPVKSFSLKLFVIPVLLFLGSGLLDSLLNMADAFYLRDDNFGIFITCVFGCAFVTGISILLINPVHRRSFHIRNVYGGIILGSINYFSVLFFLKALQIPGLQSSVIFPLNNIGVVGCSTLAAYILFKERLSPYNWLGIGLSVLSIIIIYMA